jgi:hypothetical protein
LLNPVAAGRRIFIMNFKMIFIWDVIGLLTDMLHIVLDFVEKWMLLEYSQKQPLIRSDIYVTPGENLRKFPDHSNATYIVLPL